MIKIIQIIGTRPQYEKLIRFKNDFVIDTGQHYTDTLCFDAPSVDVKLDWQGIREAIRDCIRYTTFYKPKVIVVYGDTFSTFIGAIAAKKTRTPLAHIEAGVPYIGTLESRIRLKVDKLAIINLCPTLACLDNVAYGYFVGDIMYDRFLQEHVHLRPDVCLCTIHRRENLPHLPTIFNKLQKYKRVWFFEHPHTKKYVEENQIIVPDNVSMYEPIDHKEMLKYLKQVKFVFTDSGGLVKEAYWSGVPFEYYGTNPWPETEAFGDGHAIERITRIVEEYVTQM